MPMSLLPDTTSCRSGPYDLSGGSDHSGHGKGSTGKGRGFNNNGHVDDGRKGYTGKLPSFDSDDDETVTSQFPADSFYWSFRASWAKAREQCCR